MLKGTVWENYQLVITQWPISPSVAFPAPFLYPRRFPPFTDVTGQPQGVQEAYHRAEKAAKASYPLQAGLPIPQSGCLNVTMETYFQNPKGTTLENTSCIGCHFGASDTDYSWALKLRTWPQPYNQGRVNPEDSKRAAKPGHEVPVRKKK